MQQFPREPENIKGIEVLSFDQVELEKIRPDGSQSFHTGGNLNVLYFEYYGRFVLQVNNWRYALLSRLPITSSQPSTYTMPAYDGTYILKFNNVAHPASLQNFEEILRNTTSFSQSTGSISMNQEAFSSIGQQEGASINDDSVHGSAMPLRKRDTLKKEVQKMADKVYYKYWDIKNPNLTELRDFETIRSTPEGLVPSHNFKREEVNNLYSFISNLF